MAEIVNLNGKFIPEGQAQLSVSTPRFLYGLGLFESMRAYNEKIVYFDGHLKRIRRSAKLIGIRFPYPLLKLKEIIQKTIQLNGFGDAYVRLTLWRGGQRTDTLIAVRKYKPYPVTKYRKGFCAAISSFRQDEHSFLAQLKSTNRLLHELGFQRAENKGFDEAIILNSRGYICEGTRSNIFFVKSKAVFTPSLASGCLGGITRKAVFDLAKRYNMKIYEGSFTALDLYKAEEAFLTNSLMGVMPLVCVEKHIIGKGTPGRNSKFFMHKYNFLLRNGN